MSKCKELEAEREVLLEIKKAAQHYRVTTTRWFGEETGAAFAALCRALDKHKDTPDDPRRKRTD
jgi:hypothetical protein